MSNNYKMICTGTSFTSCFTKGDIVIFESDGTIHLEDNTWKSPNKYNKIEDWLILLNNTSTWELIPSEEQLKPEEVIELMNEILSLRSNCKKIFGDETYNFYGVYKNFSSSEIIQRLTDYKKSKLITSISKLDYDKIVTDKLNEIYPNGWRVEE